MADDRLADAIIEAADAELRDIGVPDHLSVARRILRRIQTSGWGGGSHYLHAARSESPQEIADRLGIHRTTVWRRRVRSGGI